MHEGNKGLDTASIPQSDTITRGTTVIMYSIIFRVDNEYRKRRIKEKLVDYGFRELAPNVFLSDNWKKSIEVLNDIRGIMEYYSARYIIFKRGTKFILIIYRFPTRSSRRYMNVKRILEKIPVIYFSKGVYILPSRYGYIISELYKNVGYLEYFYVEPISKIDEKQLSLMYVEYVNSIIEKLMAKKMMISNRRTALSILKNISLLQEKIMDPIIAEIVDQNSIISILKKLGKFKLEVLKKLQNL